MYHCIDKVLLVLALALLVSLVCAFAADILEMVNTQMEIHGLG